MSRELEDISDPSSVSEEDATEVRMLSLEASSFSGPLPPPELLKQYDEVVPGAAERIISMAEAEQARETEMGRRGFELLHEQLREKEKTYRWWVALPTAVVTLLLIAVFIAVVAMDTTWEPYGVGGFIAAMSFVLGVYRLFFHNRSRLDR